MTFVRGKSPRVRDQKTSMSTDRLIRRVVGLRPTTSRRHCHRRRRPSAAQWQKEQRGFSCACSRIWSALKLSVFVLVVSALHRPHYIHTFLGSSYTKKKLSSCLNKLTTTISSSHNCNICHGHILAILSTADTALGNLQFACLDLNRPVQEGARCQASVCLKFNKIDKFISMGPKTKGRGLF